MTPEAYFPLCAARIGTGAVTPDRPDRHTLVRTECLNLTQFWSLTQARVVITDWKTEYNHVRRHSALGYQTPAGYAAACTHR